MMGGSVTATSPGILQGGGWFRQLECKTGNLGEMRNGMSSLVGKDVHTWL